MSVGRIPTYRKLLYKVERNRRIDITKTEETAKTLLEIKMDVSSYQPLGKYLGVNPVLNNIIATLSFVTVPTSLLAGSHLSEKSWDGGRWIAPSNWIQPVSWEKDVADTIRKISSVTLLEANNDTWGGIVSDISLELEEVCPDCGTADWAYGDLAKSKEVCAMCNREREYKK